MLAATIGSLAGGVVPYSASLVGPSLGGANKFLGAALSPDGNTIICPPADGANQFYAFNTQTLTGQFFGPTIAAPGGGFGIRYYGCVQAANGKIYAIPFNTTRFAEVDPVALTVTLVGPTFGAGGPGFATGVLAQTGNIIVSPLLGSVTQFAEFNPITYAYSAFGANTPSGYRSLVLLPNGFMYAAPFNGNLIAKIDPVSKTTNYLTHISGQWLGGVCGPDGNAYFTPWAGASTQWVKVTQFDVISAFGTQQGGTPWPSTGFAGGTVAASGKIIPANFAADRFVDLNTASGISNTVILGNSGYITCVLAANGKVYGVPYNATRFIEILPSGPMPASRYTMPSPISNLPTSDFNIYQNKF